MSSIVDKDKSELIAELTLAQQEIKDLNEKIQDLKTGSTSSVSYKPLQKDDSEDFYRILVENQDDLIVNIDLQHRFKYVNPSYCKTFGKTKEELIGAEFKPLIHEEDRPIVEASLSTLHDPPHKTQHVERAKTASGWRWFRWIVRGICDENDNLKEIVGLGRDITAFKQTEETLRESEEKFRSVFERAPLPFVMLDGEASILAVNRTWTELTGYSREEVIGQGIDRLLSEASRKEFETHYSRFKKDGKVHDFELELIASDGTVRNVLLDGRFYKKPDDYFLQFYCVFRDVTERTLLQEKVTSAKNKAEIYFNLASVMFVFLRSDETIQHVNNKACEILGYPSNELIGQNWFDLCIPSENKEEVRNVFNQLVEGNRELVESYENPVITSSGEERVISWHNTFFKDDNGTITGILSSGEDITERKAAYEELLASNEREKEIGRLLESVLNAIPDVIGVQDRNHRIIRYNEAGYAFLQTTHEGVIGKRCFELIGRNRPCEVCATSETYKTKKPAKVVKFVPEFNIWLDVRSYPVLNENGKIVNVIEHLRDITERKVAEEELRENKRKLKTLFNNLPGVAYRCRVDQNWTMEFVSKGCESLTGYSQEDLIDNRTISFGELVHPEDRQKVWDVVEEGIHKKQRFELEYRIINKSGDVRWVHEQGVSVHSESSDILEGYISDITEQKKAKDALQSSEARLRAFFDYSPVGLVIFEAKPKGQFLSVNETLARLLHRQIEDIVGLSYEVFDNFDTIRHHDKIVESVLKTRHSQTLDFLAKTSDDQTIFCFGSYFPILDSEKNILAIGGVVLDLTELKKAEGDKEKLEEQLRQTQKLESIGRLAGGIAHDFNNLLTGISGNILLAKMETPPDDPMYETFTEIIQASNRAAELVKQLLAFSRKQIIKPKPLQLNESVRSMVQMIKRIIGEDIILTLELQENIASVKADPSQVEQMLINLAINARDAMPKGGKLLIETAETTLDESYCDSHFEVKPGTYIFLAITDTGHGIPQESLAKIFEPFYSTKPRSSHSGLGLSTVIGIIKQHKGHVQVYSEIGEGTTFKLYLPILEKNTEQPEKIGKTPVVFSKGAETVLVVEDEPIVRKMAVKILKRLGYNPLEARNGIEGKQVAETNEGTIDVLLTDVVMPKMNGKELAEALKQLNPDLKVLFTSGYTENVIAHHGVLDSGIHFIGKPYGPKELSRKLREVLDS